MAQVVAIRRLIAPRARSSPRQRRRAVTTCTDAANVRTREPPCSALHSAMLVLLAGRRAMCWPQSSTTPPRTRPGRRRGTAAQRRWRRQTHASNAFKAGRLVAVCIHKHTICNHSSSLHTQLHPAPKPDARTSAQVACCSKWQHHTGQALPCSSESETNSIPGLERSREVSSHQLLQESKLW